MPRLERVVFADVLPDIKQAVNRYFDAHFFQAFAPNSLLKRLPRILSPAGQNIIDALAVPHLGREQLTIADHDSAGGSTYGSDSWHPVVCYRPATLLPSRPFSFRRVIPPALARGKVSLGALSPEGKPVAPTDLLSPGSPFQAGARQAIPVDAGLKSGKVARFSFPPMNDDKKLPSPQDSAYPVDHAPQSDLPPDADIEDRFNDFWKKNGPAIFGVIALIAVVVVGYQVYDYLQDRKADRLSSEFNTLETPEEKLNFAERNAGGHLASLAFIEIADYAYAAENFTDAVERYEAALPGLEGNPISGRARLGAAMARLRLGDANAAVLLDQLARDPGVLDPIRGEAAYLLAATQLAEGQTAEARRALDLLGTLDNAPQWQQRGLQLESQLPSVEDAA